MENQLLDSVSDYYASNDELKKESLNLYQTICKETNKHPSLFEGIPIRYKDCEYLYQDGYIYLIKYFGTEEEFNVPNGVFEVASNAFVNNKYLKKITFPKNLRTIGKSAFAHCSNLEHLIFAEGIYAIGESAFFDLPLIKEVTFPRTISVIDHKAFGSCPKLKKVKFNGENYACNGNPFIDTSLQTVEFKGIPHMSKYLNHLLDLTRKNCGLVENDYRPIVIYGIPLISYLDDLTQEKLINHLQNPRTLPYSKYSRSIIDFNILRKDDIFSEYNELDKGYTIKFCNELLITLIQNIKKEQVAPIIFNKLNYENFIPNMYILMKAGFNSEEVKRIILDNNFNLLSNNIEEAFKNYQWLLNQKLLTTEVMNNFFFDGERINNINDLKRYYETYKKLPKLFNTLLVNSNDEKSLQELRDRLTYISSLELLNYTNKENIRKAQRIMQQDLFKSIVEEDEDNMKIIKKTFSFDDKPEIFRGIYTPLYKKMNGIDETWFFNFFELYYEDRKTFNDFLNSLTSLKDWSNFSNEKERAIFLKNEIFGRLLYADLVNFAQGKTFQNENELISLYRRNKKINPQNTNISTLLKLATGDKNDLFSNSIIVRAMLKLDPYSFDALREIDLNKTTKTSLEMRYVKMADDSGYYLSDEVRDDYRRITGKSNFRSRKEKTFIEYLNNQIDISMNNSSLSTALEDRIKKFVNSSDLDELYNICNIFDFHLRNSKEYAVSELEGNDFSKDSKLVFDRTSIEFETQDEMPRVLYCLFNLNKLSKHNYDFKVKKCDDLRLSDTNDVNRYFAKVDRYRRDIEILDRNGISTNLLSEYYKSYQSRNGNENKIKRANKMISRIQKDYAVTISKDLMLEIVDLYDSYPNRKDFDQCLSSKVQNDSIVSTLYEECKSTKIQEYMLMSSLIMYSLGISDTPQNSPIKETIADIFDLIEMYPEDLKDIEIAANEQRIAYICKHLFSKYAMSRFGLLSQETIIDSVKLSKEEKINRFKDLGYAVEVQKDGNGELVLACYCKGITDSFCVHLKDVFDDSIVTKLKDSCDPSNYLIATTQIPDRLRLIGSENAKIDITTCNKDGPWTGFNPATDLPAEQTMQLRNDVAYKNADTFGVVDLIAQNNMKPLNAESLTDSASEMFEEKGQHQREELSTEQVSSDQKTRHL